MTQAPLIREFLWGRITIADGTVYRDAKLWPGGSREWDWKETGMRHAPGIGPEEVRELLNYGVDTVVLSRGQDLVLQTRPETLHELIERGVLVVHLESRAAVARYNDLVTAGRRVAALIHSTC